MNDRAGDNVILVVAVATTVLGISMLTGPLLPAIGLIIAGVLGVVAIVADVDRIGDRFDFPDGTSTEPEDDAVAVLRRRYARGEIDEVEFESRLDDLLEAETVEQAANHHDDEPIAERFR